MCTASWLKRNNQIHFFFNRDESKKRPSATPPKIYNNQSIYLKDKESNGTCLLVNNNGFIIALLNNDNLKNIEFTKSRGEIPLKFKNVKNFFQVKKILQNINYKNYQPFKLLILNKKGEKIFYTSNGKALKKTTLKSNFISSSSYKPKKVLAFRKETYSTIEYKTIKKLRKMHFNSIKSQENLSILTNRNCSQTHSISEIVLSKYLIHYNYTDLINSSNFKELTLNR